MTLLDLKQNEEATIVSIAGGCTVTQRLTDLCLAPRVKIKVIIRAPFLWPVEILVRNSKLALGRGIASRVLVESIKWYEEKEQNRRRLNRQC